MAYTPYVNYGIEINSQKENENLIKSSTNALPIAKTIKIKAT